SSLLISSELETINLSGLVQIDLVINEQRIVKESRYNNNFGTFNLFVEGDGKNPILKAFFDGIEIMDGDLISAKPEIKITLLDENKFKLLQDTSLIDIHLLAPGSSSWQR